ncbi:MAG: type II toxin-antitoxin system prevent-host-death family antitoxin [Nitrospirae bacterium]|nr:type II toxin-antitoxin system prevent-host-death family antitoxin [Nitrospirota bacterium]MBI3393345.1 type II toxin-antitoxin system prevent-host-death family antitoxin [Nitrospirota bacterium]
MKTMTAKDLKNHTGEVMRRVSRGEEVLVTLRGRPAAVILPFAAARGRAEGEARSFEEAWGDIEASLRRTGPAFKTWREAIGWSRKRASLR